jgi:hypothetical protein
VTGEVEVLVDLGDGGELGAASGAIRHPPVGGVSRSCRGVVRELGDADGSGVEHQHG